MRRRDVAKRFLLDQNFPRPVVEVDQLDATIEYVGLDKFDPSLTMRGTPDWLIYLRAVEDGTFDGVVTRDASQLENTEELVVLIDTELSVVTWKTAVEDPITEWGQLLAYMPLVVKRMDLQSGIFYLPKPSLGRDNASNARAELGKLAASLKRSFPELRSEARRTIKSELTRRGLTRLMDQVSRRES
jgi:hypothetical protein